VFKNKEKISVFAMKFKNTIKFSCYGIAFALIIRALLIQAFYIPSESMENTLLIGDALFVNKMIYGTSIPFTGKKILALSKVSREDIIVFESPEDSKIDFVKRVVGLPGDTIEIREKQLFINNKPINQSYAVNKDKLVIKASGSSSTRDFYGPVTVPQGSYFMMGDNRDFSYDSRFWGFLDEKNIKGKAMFIYFSKEKGRFLPRFARLGKWIK
jgi:signal peptidase I